MSSETENVRTDLAEKVKSYLIEKPSDKTVYAWPENERFRFNIEIDCFGNLSVSLFSMALDEKIKIVAYSSCLITFLISFKRVRLEIEHKKGHIIDRSESSDEVFEDAIYDAVPRVETIELTSLDIPPLLRGMVDDLVAFYDNLPLEDKPSDKFCTWEWNNSREDNGPVVQLFIRPKD